MHIYKSSNILNTDNYKKNKKKEILNTRSTQFVER